MNVFELRNRLVEKYGDFVHGFFGLDHSVGHLRTCAVDFEAQAVARLSLKSPQTGSAVSDQKTALPQSCRQGASGKSCESWSGRPVYAADQALEAGGYVAIDSRFALPHWNLNAGISQRVHGPVFGGPSGFRGSVGSRPHPLRTGGREAARRVAEAARPHGACGFGPHAQDKRRG